MTNEPIKQQFTTLTDIRAYKERLMTEIRKDEDEIVAEWHRLFRESSQKGKTTPSKRLSNIVNTGVAAFDGLLLAWKLYRKYRNSTALFRRRQR